MLAALAVNAAFTSRGEAATYTPDGGTAVPCRVVVDRAVDAAERLEDRVPGVERLTDGLPRGGYVAIDVRKAEISAPARKGVFAITDTGESFRVQTPPRVFDSLGLIWSMLAVPAAS